MTDDTITLPRLAVAALTAAAEAWYAALVEQGVPANGTPRLLELEAALREADAALDTVVS